MRLETFALPVPGGKLCGDVQGAGPPVVLLHGFTLDRSVWDEPAAALATRHRVVRLDLRGHGASPMAAAPYLAADDVPRVLDALGLARAALVGLSWGGQVALDTALVHPARVSALGLVDATLPGHDWSAEWRAMVKSLRALANGPAGPAAAARAWFASPLFDPAHEHASARARLAAWETPRAGRAWAGRDPALAAEPLAAGRLSEIRVPTLIVVGERDRDDFQAIARALESGIAGAVRVVLKGVGHLSPLEAPDELARVLSEFLDALPDA